MFIHQIVQLQRDYFSTGATRSVDFRLSMLKKLAQALQAHAQRLCQALAKDFKKSSFETYMTELGQLDSEIRFHLRHLPNWARDRRVYTPLSQFYARSFVSPEPYGVALIMAPWNYPLLLCLEPLVGAISAGNCAVLKPSAYAPKTSHAIAQMLGDIFPAHYIAVVEGGREENQALLAERFDYIFFTGSVSVGKTVMRAAAEHLTPVTLELGGKSPVIVDESANLPIAARRIAFGKVLNAGQTCVAPDYLLLPDSLQDRFLSEYRQALADFFPDGELRDFPSIINKKHFDRITALMQGEKIAIGGFCDAQRRLIEPTVLIQVSPDAPIMQEEIFGPVLPIVSVRDTDEAIQFVRARAKPLALYLFTESKAVEKKVLRSCSFGGGCINDTIIHLATPHMGFGGVGESGMGQYHGKLSFDTFSHKRSLVKKSTRIDLSMRYHPYTEKHLRAIRFFLK